MTNQELFVKVARHLLTQKTQARIGEACAYRVGTKSCAVGCLILDEYYDPKFEGIGIGGICVIDNEWITTEPFENYKLLATALNKSGVPTSSRALLRTLQSTHDCVLPSNWRSELLRVAAWYNLAFPEYL